MTGVQTCALPICYPAEIPALTDRIPLGAVVHRETYRNDSIDEIRAFYALKEALESSERFVKENNREPLAQVFTDVRYSEKDNLFFSEKMLEVLREQGFLR